MLRICDGDMRVPPYLYIFNSHKRVDEVLDWMLRNHFTGKNFILWAQGVHERSILEVIKEILMRIDKEKEIKPIIAGIDYIRR